MKIKFIPYSLFFVMLALQACCSKEYITGAYLQRFALIDAATGNNLLFGINKIYNVDSVLVKCSNDTEYKKVTVLSNLSDSVVYINFNYANTCFIKFTDNDIDTFTMQYIEREARNQRGVCRQSYMDMVSLKYNNVALSLTDNPIKIYK